MPFHNKANTSNHVIVSDSDDVSMKTGTDLIHIVGLY
jgi:hypothetical protein